MKKFLLSALLFVAPLAAEAEDRLLTLTEGQLSRVEEAVKSSLRDPDSAKFYDLIARGNAAMVTVCGEVNAKNAFGGYAGKMPFSVFLMPEGDVPTLGDTPLMLDTVENICRTVRHGSAVAETMVPAPDPAYQDALLEQFRVTDKMCRGEPGDSPLTQSACEMRSRVESEMTKAGLCLSGNEWQRCN